MKSNINFFSNVRLIKMSAKPNHHFAGPKVNFPSNFPKPHQVLSPSNQCKELISKFSQQLISRSDFFSQLLKVQNNSKEDSFCILNCMIFYLLYCKPYHSTFTNQFAALFSKLIQNKDESIRRSTLSLISLTINNKDILKSLADDFSSWNNEAKEIFLSFAFSFQGADALELEVFLNSAKASLQSESEGLALTASDFIEFINYFIGRQQNSNIRKSVDISNDQRRRSISIRKSQNLQQNNMKNEEHKNIKNSEIVNPNITNHGNKSESKEKDQESNAHDQECNSLRLSKQKHILNEIDNNPFYKKSLIAAILENDSIISSKDFGSSMNNDNYTSLFNKSFDTNNLPNINSKSLCVDENKSDNIDDAEVELFSSSDCESLLDSVQFQSNPNKQESKSDYSNPNNDDNLESNLIESINRKINLIQNSTSQENNSINNFSSTLENAETHSKNIVQKNSKNYASTQRLDSSKSQKHVKLSYLQSSVNTSNLCRSKVDNNKTAPFISQTLKSDKIDSSIKQDRKAKAEPQLKSKKESPLEVLENDSSISFSSSIRPSSARRNKKVDSSSEIGNNEILMTTTEVFLPFNQKEEEQQKKISDNLNIADLSDDYDDSDYSDDLFGAPVQTNCISSESLPANKLNQSINTADSQLNEEKQTKTHNYDFIPDQLDGEKTKKASKLKIPQSGKLKKNNKSNFEKTPEKNEKLVKCQSTKPKKISPQSPEKGDNGFNDSNMYSYISSLSSKDWEQQQSSLDFLKNAISFDSSKLAPYCKEIWMNLLDIIVSPRTALANSALCVTADLFSKFSQQLTPHTPPFISICFNLCCKSQQFIAESAGNVLFNISILAPRNKVLSHFIQGTKHKNSIARGKAVQCISNLINQGKLDDSEMKLILTTLSHLIRDNKIETRDAARYALSQLVSDNRFNDIASSICTNQHDFKELMKVVDI